VTASVHVDAAGRRATIGSGAWTYEFGDVPKPFFHPVRTPAGLELSRDAPPTHPWHHGLWFAIKFVNGDNFWEELPPFGTARHTAPPLADGASISGELRWIRPDGEVVVDERRRLEHVDLDAQAYAIDFHLELTPRVDVELDRTPYTTWGGYSGLAFRGTPALGATRFLVDGNAEQASVTGTRGRWLDLSGRFGDGAAAGIALLDRPGNPDYPVSWYGHTDGAVYGDTEHANFANAAFLWDGPRPVPAGQTLRFDYRAVVHDGMWAAADVDGAYDEWIAGATS
jgi:hypothetical protein